METEATHDEMTVAFQDQLDDDLAKQAESQSAAFVWDEGFYMAQYKKNTMFASDKETFTRKDGSTFVNPLYKVPVGAFVFDLLGFAGRKGDAILEWEKPKGFSFKATFQRVMRDSEKMTEESVNGGLMQACAAANGFAGKTTTELLDWFANHICVIHIGKMKASSDGKWPARNLLRAIRPHNG